MTKYVIEMVISASIKTQVEADSQEEAQRIVKADVESRIRRAWGKGEINVEFSTRQ